MAARWNAHCHVVCGHVRQHHRIGSNDRVVSDDDRSQQLRPGTDVDVPPDGGGSPGDHSPERHLLKDEAVRSDLGIRMDHYPVRMRKHEPLIDLADQRNIGARHHTPEAMPEHGPPFQRVKQNPGMLPALVVTNAGQKPFARIPFAKAESLALPVGVCGADGWLVIHVIV